ncbi:GIY-YIG nuclease family protein [Asanoa iriomotensis]|uniref:GIY-YIG nuclease family protein n=1 Tax=Asanoa iriomotensis TaxID=234613 RepID=UPI00194074A7|nr:hypothetical protein [Asanoa iriomotensis]
MLARPGPVPAAAGVYAWYFPVVPSLVPVEGCHRFGGATLLYVGISPKAPAMNGRPPSRQTIRQRIRYHFRGNAYGSTLRLTLGSLLADELGIRLTRVGSGTRLTFDAGEARLTEWMAANARVVWTVVDRSWDVEHELIRSLELPLNLAQDKRHPFHRTLSRLVAEQRNQARVRGNP